MNLMNEGYHLAWFGSPFTSKDKQMYRKSHLMPERLKPLSMLNTSSTHRSNTMTFNALNLIVV